MLFSASIIGWLILAVPTANDNMLLPNPDFDKGDQSPSAWTLSGGKGRWVDRHVLEVTGSGTDSNSWQCDYRFTPVALYRFETRARRISGSGCAITGPSFANLDIQPTDEWRWYGYFFRAPDRVEDSHVRLGQWQANGAIQFDAVRMMTALPVHKITGDLVLGQGESIRGGRYTFSGTFSGQGSNFHRTLYSATADFNSDRWCFGPDSHATYRFGVPGHEFRSGSMSFNINYHTRGACVAEISLDGKTWQTLVVQKGLGTPQAAVPAELLPAKTIYLRCKAQPASSFQIDQISFQADLSGSPPEATGQTLLAKLARINPDLTIEEILLPDSPTAGRLTVKLMARNKSDKPIKAALHARSSPGRQSSDDQKSRNADQVIEAPAIAAGQLHTFTLELPAGHSGRNEIGLELVDRTHDQSTLARFDVVVSELDRADYGSRVEGVDAAGGVWWCDAMHKVSRDRSLPERTSPAAQMSAARNDREAVQIVLHPKQPLTGVTVQAAPLTGPQGAVIPAQNIQILRVCYHFVQHPTDQTGVSGWWPDALPPLTKPISVPAGKNQPFWVLVHISDDARPGDYSGQVTFKGDRGFSAVIPLKLHVWNFTLPKRNHLETAFGLSPHEIYKYHQLKTDEDKRRVFDMYRQSFAEHRISPYDPVPLDPVAVRFIPTPNPHVELDFSKFDPAMSRAIDKFNFTNFMVHLEGMGGGTFHSRVEPKIAGFGENTPEYQAMFSSYVKQLQDHLRAKGWDKMAYTYWFDEPAAKDFAFVRAGMDRLKKHAPGLQTMLTIQPEEALAGPIDIWCPNSPNYNHAAAEKQRAHDERFWWYVCCGPKAPYCTLFIDHPAADLRVWLWQTWQRKINGILIWSANYWTSDTAFPDAPQNPYDDPMGYVSGYGVPRGTEQYWGNGDGRFLYPPESAAVPGTSGKAPVLDPPVSSIRWEMLREGIEDYEFLCLLRDRLDRKCTTLKPEQVKTYEALLEVPPEITRDMTTYTTDPAPIYARRAAIAEAIERLGE